MSLMKRLAICGISIALPLAAASQADAGHGHHSGHHQGHHHGHYGAPQTMTVPVVRRTYYRVIRSACAPAYLEPLSSHIIRPHGHMASHGVAGAPVGGAYSSGYGGTGMGLGGTGLGWGTGSTWGTAPQAGFGTGIGFGVNPMMGRGFGVGPTVGVGRGSFGMW